MLRTGFHFLTFCALFSLLCFSLFLLYNKTSANLQPATNGHKSLFMEMTENVTKAVVQQMESKKSEAKPAVKEEKKEEVKEPEKKLLETCSDNPPALVGPLRVEFDFKGSLEDLKTDVGVGLEMGGRYKPPNCVSKYKVAIIIPFRNRHEHLKHWLYYLHPILKRQLLDYGVYVINQAGNGKFNRAKLLNVGFLEALKQYDYNCFVFSDVDLVPLNDRNLYRCFDNPRHLAVGMDKFGYNLPYNTYFGGVSSMSKTQFEKINGCPNTYWGWGGEDDDLYNRVMNRGMTVSRPDLMTGRYRMVKHDRDKHNEPNPVNPGKLSGTRWTMEKDGLNSLSYKVVEITNNILFSNVTVDIEAPPG
ncbi:beta-1,4-galactosyltransferase 1-like [Gouania willdenowi]|uniref:Beta-1,4-galactosyltransferase n=1 Tax=Gouania willdenowi TaxID=441366 RepID=A0A8C5GYR2_GOUWI|nr:beta-1,4-galactosyltransferase 1-like [Gouania willdenowi]